MKEPRNACLIVAMVTGINALTLMISGSFAVLYQPFMDKFDATREDIGWAFSLQSIIAAVAGLLSAPFIKRYGCRSVALVGVLARVLGHFCTALTLNLCELYIYFGILTGVGTGFVRISVNCVIQQSFTERRDLMARVSNMGYHIGEAAGPLLSTVELDLYGLQGALITQAGVHAQGLVLSMMFQDRRVTTKSEHVSESLQDRIWTFWRDLLDLSLLKDTEFVCLFVARFLQSSCKSTLLIHVVNAARLVGIDDTSANYLPAMISITALGCGLINISLVKWLNPSAGFTIGILCSSVGCFSAAYGSYPMFVASMILLGCDEGLSYPSICMWVYGIVGDDSYAKGLSLIDLAQIPAFYISGPVAGMLADYWGSYSQTFIIAGTMGLAAVVNTTLAHICGRRKNPQYEKLVDNFSHNGLYQKLIGAENQIICSPKNDLVGVKPQHKQHHEQG